MEVEIMGVLKAMQYCETDNFQKIILETDSLTLKNMLLKQWKIPWSYAEKIESIHQSITRKQVQVKHIFQEANQLADYLANMALDQAEFVQVQSFHNLPSRGR
ncbi:hypothetical protein KY285_005231 [Solanum tuberosum]|nr:hypothetical protein KY285_005231 [Solanum tuberosum]